MRGPIHARLRLWGKLPWKTRPTSTVVKLPMLRNEIGFTKDHAHSIFRSHSRRTGLVIWSGVLGCIYLDWFLIELALCSEVSTPILLQLASSSRQSWRMKLSTAFATALVLAGGVSAESKSSKAAALERFWSYGRSEPVYPTRKVSSKKIARLELFFF